MFAPLIDLVLTVLLHGLHLVDKGIETLFPD